MTCVLISSVDEGSLFINKSSIGGGAVLNLGVTFLTPVDTILSLRREEAFLLVLVLTDLNRKFDLEKLNRLIF